MKETDYLEDMYRDSYFPNFLVDKIKGYLKEVVSVWKVVKPILM
jgi:hypothetical protein